MKSHDSEVDGDRSRSHCDPLPALSIYAPKKEFIEKTWKLPDVQE